MQRECRALLIVFAACFAVSLAAGQDKSCLADVFVLDSLSKRPQVTSPDGRLRLVLGGYEDSDVGSLNVYNGSRLLRHIELKDLSGGIFLKWAPDSQAFYVMWSNGGMVGGYSVRVFRVSLRTVTEVPTVRIAENDFKRKHDCPARGVNVFAVKWKEGSKALLVAMEVYPSSDCEQMGFTAGYLVSTTEGTILRRFPESQISAEMKHCPSKIWPTGLWDDQTLQSAKAQVGKKTN